VISDKHEDVMAKFGAILAQGIIDAGGRNVTVSLQSRSGHTNMAAVVGLLVFNQFWLSFLLCFTVFICNCLVSKQISKTVSKVHKKQQSQCTAVSYRPIRIAFGFCLNCL